jgi:hypothetical protein
MKRCSRGFHRNKKSKECEKVSSLSNNSKKRCTNGTRKNKKN